MSFLECLNACNHFDRQAVLPFLIDHQQVGWIKKTHYPLLKNRTEFFQLDIDQVHLADQFNNYDQRTHAIAEVVLTSIFMR
ncbi:MAG: DUF4743 domain-containing protein [Proteobacteria bacterium]|nr:DUF4743 domain-containing protein [Pseudomonadota bacterium]